MCNEGQWLLFAGVVRYKLWVTSGLQGSVELLKDSGKYHSFITLKKMSVYLEIDSIWGSLKYKRNLVVIHTGYYLVIIVFSTKIDAKNIDKQLNILVT